MSQFADTKAIAGQTVGHIAATLPGAAAIFQGHGVDFCCGGDRTLADAAAKRALDLDALIGELAAANPVGEVSWDTASTADLIEHVITRYHSVHLRELPWLIRLAHKVEAAHKENGRVPAGLADLLSRLLAGINVHQRREEVVLFPMMQAGGGPMIEAAIATMRAEHDDHGAVLAEIDRLSRNRTAPDDACATWRALCVGLTKFHDDLMTHVHIENNILFPRFAGNSATHAA
ncbi:MAG: iron-sulfur cluster repair di-iron protein [Acidiphilium sp.]